jgi:hypothetical protein
VTRLATLLGLLGLLVGLAGSVASYLAYRPSGLGEWTAAAANLGSLAFAEPWVAAVAGAAAIATVLVAVHLVLDRSRRREKERTVHPPPSSSAESSRRRRTDFLKVAAALSWLALAVGVFRVPLEVALGPLARGAGLDRLAPPAPGCVLRVTSEPPGGRLSVNGIGRGEAPMIANVFCKEGQPIHLRVEAEGYSPWEREVECREGQSLAVEARLSK